MKRLALITVFAPGTALAHGAHAPVPEVAHGFAHVGPLAGLVLIVAAFGARWVVHPRRN
ncbi:hypothetical protein [Silicimonas sp. MF1-12-2]|uniref:hypothetical protein n=1 Tax=Silicimonas sp. MF1-12-2 TaxID=3384793 RepID=UPI0039B45E7B